MAARKGLRAALQLYTVRDGLKDEKNVRASLKKVRKAGYGYVELACLDAYPADDLASWLDEAGLAAVGTHTSLPALEGDFAAAVERACRLGYGHLTIGGIARECWATPAAVRKTGARFKAVAAKARKAGLLLQYHNHSFEFIRLGGKTLLEQFFAAGGKDLYAELDVAWVARGLACPVEWIGRVAGRCLQLHVKDAVMTATAQGVDAKWTEVGAGNLPWAALFAAAKKAGVRDYIVEQDADWLAGDPFKSVAVSYKFLAKNGIK